MEDGRVEVVHGGNTITGVILLHDVDVGAIFSRCSSETDLLARGKVATGGVDGTLVHDSELIPTKDLSAVSPE